MKGETDKSVITVEDFNKPPPSAINKLADWRLVKIPKYLISINSGMGEKGLLWITKDVPLLLSQEIINVLGALCQEKETKT